MPNAKKPTSEAAVFSTEREIRERAEELLAGHPYREVKDVVCEYQDGALILNGRLPTFHLKQLAQAAITELCAVVRIDNRIEVPDRGEQEKG